MARPVYQALTTSLITSNCNDVKIQVRDRQQINVNEACNNKQNNSHTSNNSLNSLNCLDSNQVNHTDPPNTQRNNIITARQGKLRSSSSRPGFDEHNYQHVTNDDQYDSETDFNHCSTCSSDSDELTTSAAIGCIEENDELIASDDCIDDDPISSINNIWGKTHLRSNSASSILRRKQVQKIQDYVVANQENKTLLTGTRKQQARPSSWETESFCIQCSRNRLQADLLKSLSSLDKAISEPVIPVECDEESTATDHFHSHELKTQHRSNNTATRQRRLKRNAAVTPLKNTQLACQQATLALPIDANKKIVSVDHQFKNGHKVRRFKYKTSLSDFAYLDRVHFNVGGEHFTTLASTLERYPHTLLGNMIKLEEYFDEKAGEFVFMDRSRRAFPAILFFYQSNGILSRPKDLPKETFVKDLMFYGLAREKLEEELALPDNKHLSRIWSFFEYPEQMSISRTYAYFSMFMIAASIVVLTLESTGLNENSTSDKPFQGIWFLLETIFIVYFTVEYILRVISTPNRRLFTTSFFGIVDLVCVLPYYMTLALSLSGSDINTGIRRILAPIRILRLFQVGRILKSSKYSTALQILAQQFKASSFQGFALIAFCSIALVFCASLIHVFEHKENEESFTSVPDTFWYTVITMTTVGYGDIVAVTPMGKIATSLTIFVGTVVFFFLLVPWIYTCFFEVFYDQELEFDQEYTVELKEEIRVVSGTYSGPD